jgi:hypothetical protein
MHDAESWRNHWQELQEYVSPRKGRYLADEDQEDNDGKKRHQSIINSTATRALRVLAAGMMGGLTSPSRPWFELTLDDPDLAKWSPVKIWLEDVGQRMLSVIGRSNFYSSMSSIYAELGLFGTGVVITEADFRTVIRTRHLTAGEYYLALDRHFRPDTLYRRFSMTARQAVRMFKEENVSDSIKQAYHNDDYQTRFKIVQAIQPRRDSHLHNNNPRGMPFASVYFEDGGNNEDVLSIGGFRSKPFAAARWEVEGSDTYGMSPAMDILGDVKQIHKMDEKKLVALDKLVDPPMVGPTGMVGASIIPGDVTYIDPNQGQAFGPAYQVRPNTGEVSAEVARVEERIRGALFNDLFISIMNENKSMTATEVAERRTEKMMLLGPVVEKIQQDLLDPIINRIYSIMHDFRMFPPPPQEIQGQDWNIKYMGILAQAQRAVDTTGIDQVVVFASNLAQVQSGAGTYPQVLDKLDFDEAVEQYAQKIGVPPRIIRDAQAVGGIREQRAKQQAAQAQAAQMERLAEGAKTLGDASTEENTMLGQLLSVR